MRRALRRAADGRALDVDEAAALLAARGGALDELLAAAAAVRDAGLRDAGRPGVVTYSKKVFIPLTRLCRDRCHYCTFATVPHRLPAAVPGARRGAGDRPGRAPRRAARRRCSRSATGRRSAGRRPGSWLDERGYDSTLDYLRACAVAVLEETGLLPHLNPGVLSLGGAAAAQAGRAEHGHDAGDHRDPAVVEPGGPHYGSPDKEPAVRLRVLDDAGRVGVPFTTGILIGIGETLAERVDALFAIRRVAREYGHLQEVIVQNFRAKPDTAMRGMPDAELHDLAATVAVARLLLGPKARIQAPPNLIDGEYDLLLRAGIDDWGGVSPVTPDHVNPERPWPQIDELAGQSAESRLHAARAADHLPGVRPAAATRGSTRGCRRTSPRWPTRPPGWPSRRAMPVGRPWQEPDGGFGDAAASTCTPPSTPPAGPATGAATSTASTATGPRSPRASPHLAPVDRSATPTSAGGLRLAADDPAALLEPEHEAAALALFDADGPALDELAALADDLRRDAVGDDVTYVVNRNINFTNVCYVGCRFCAFAQRERDADAYRLSVEQVADRAEEAWPAGATEVCMQGGIDPKLPVTAYADLVRGDQGRGCRACTCTRSRPMEIVTGAAKAGVPVRDWLSELREAGLDTIPGTAAEILDDDVRWVLTKGKLPAAAWVEVVSTAHELGIRSSSTMMYGHVDHPRQWLGHFRVLAEIQDRTGGFTEFVALPFVHTNAPDLPGRHRPARPDLAGEPGGARDGPAAAARPDRQHPVLLGEARRRRHAWRCSTAAATTSAAR